MSRPNVLVVVFDTVRADHVACYGHDRPTTPTVDGLAADGVRFEHAFSTSNWTGTAHGSLFTGLLPSRSGVFGEHQTLPDDAATLTELLADAGYRTFVTAAGANLRPSKGYGRGVDEFVKTYPVGLDGFPPSRDDAAEFLRDRSFRRQVVQDAVRGHDNQTVYKFGKLREWLDDGGDDPFFALVNSKAAHHPYHPPRPYQSRFCDRLSRPRLQFVENRRGGSYDVDGLDADRLRAISESYPLLGDAFEPTSEEWAAIRSFYDGAIRYLDDRLGAFLDYLDRTGELEDTYVVVTSDHGDLFGEQGLEKHHLSLHQKLVHVPLVVRPPGGTDGRTVFAPVSLADLFPTVLEFAGLDADRDYATSLADLEDRRYHDHVYAEVAEKPEGPVASRHPGFDGFDRNGPLQLAQDDRYRLLVHPERENRLFDWRDDPGSEQNLVDEKPGVADELRARIDDRLDSLTKESEDGGPDSEELLETLEDLGYL
jgi:arylsulfatase A-like enzyme